MASQKTLKKKPKITQIPPLFQIKPYKPERITLRLGAADYEKLPSRAGGRVIAFRGAL